MQGLKGEKGERGRNGFPGLDGDTGPPGIDVRKIKPIVKFIALIYLPLESMIIPIVYTYFYVALFPYCKYSDI